MKDNKIANGSKLEHDAPLTAEKSGAKIKLNEERFDKIINEVEEYAILLLDINGTVSTWNRGAERIKKYRSDEIIGKSFKLFYTEEDKKNGKPEMLLKRALEEGKANDEGWRVRKDGTKFWGNITLTALHNEAQEVIGFSKVTRDLTDRKNAEDIMRSTAVELKEKNKILENLNKELSSFVYIVSHDLKEPIRKIQVFAGRQLEPGKSTEKIIEFASKIEATAFRMQKLMEDLLQFSEISTPSTLEKVDLNEILDIVKSDLEVAIHEANGKIHSDHLPVIDGIAFQLRQLFLNLLSNAIKFRKQTEQLKIDIRCRTVKGETISPDVSLHSKTFFEIVFADNGIGFDPQYADKIFNVFYRLQPKTEFTGSGIGLAIVNKVIVNHSGIVKAESEPDKGSEFKLYFPVKEQSK